MGQVIQISDRLKNRGEKNCTSAETHISDFSPRQHERAKRFKIFYDHLLGLLEAASTVEEKTELEKARRRQKLMRDGVTLDKKTKGFSAERINVGEALFVDQLMDGPLEDLELATALAHALREVLFRSFEGRKLSVQQRQHKQQQLTEYVMKVIGQTKTDG